MKAAAASSVFERAYPSYETTRALDELRAREYPALAALDCTYLDYTAANLYATSQLERHFSLLRDHVFGNPHSTNPTSSFSTSSIARVRQRVLAFFNASPDEWAVIFTTNASQALKLVGESYPFGPQSRYLLTFDNHNSVNGFGNSPAQRAPPRPTFRSCCPRCGSTNAISSASSIGSTSARQTCLPTPPSRIFPACSIRSNGLSARTPADGTSCSTPRRSRRRTGSTSDDGRRTSWCSPSTRSSGTRRASAACSRAGALAKLRRPWFAGGTITVASVQGDKHYLAEGESGFEDGTLDFLALPAVEIGLQHIDAIGMDTIHERVRCLTGWLLDNLLALRQTGGQPLARLYGPPTTDRRGGIVTFNFYDRAGRAIDHRVVEDRASAANISLRTGCFCNPGGGEIALGLTGTELSSCFRQPEHETHLTVDDFRMCIDGKSTGAVRVSLGLVSNVADVDRFIGFAKQFIGK